MLDRRARWLTLVLCSSLFACGDDSVTGGASEGGGGSSDGGSPQGGAPQGGAPQGGAPQGGAPQGGAPQGGSAQGGAGGSSGPGADGALCDENEECLGGVCLTELDLGLPGGMCTEDCTASGVCTAAGSSCALIQEDPDVALCFRDCDPDTAGSCGEPDTLGCVALGGTPQGGLCFSSCNDDADCTIAENVCQPDAFCAPLEICDNTIDDDFDGTTDCGDADCAQVPACAAACASAIAALPSNVGDTLNGTTQFESNCTGTLGGGEVVYTYTAAATGGLDLTLQSATDQGLHVRTVCLDGGSELGCVDDLPGNVDEQLTVGVQSGQQVFIFVDAFAPGEEGPYTLLLAFQAGTPDANCIGGTTNTACEGGESCLCEDCWTAPGCQSTCVPDAVCDVNDDDCVCADCDADPFCSDPLNCVDNNVCDPFNEGCICTDCAPNPECTGVPVEPECVGATPNAVCSAGESCQCSDCIGAPICTIGSPYCVGAVTNGACEVGETCLCADCTTSAACQASCTANGMCGATEDCVCADCDADPFCSNPVNCNNDGACDPFNEGCVCGDCGTNPACSDNFPSCDGGIVGGTCGATEPCSCPDCGVLAACNTDPTCTGNVANGTCDASEPCSCADCTAAPQCGPDPDCLGGLPNGVCGAGESCACIDCTPSPGCQANCTPGGGCTLTEDCVCDDCDADSFCSDPLNCSNNGVCDPFNEGCVCADCATNPACLN